MLFQGWGYVKFRVSVNPNPNCNPNPNPNLNPKTAFFIYKKQVVVVTTTKTTMVMMLIVTIKFITIDIAPKSTFFRGGGSCTQTENWWVRRRISYGILPKKRKSI